MIALKIKHFLASLLLGFDAIPLSSGFHQQIFPSISFANGLGRAHLRNECSSRTSNGPIHLWHFSMNTRADAPSPRQTIRTYSAVVVRSEWTEDDKLDSHGFSTSVLPVLSSALLITGNTVGAGMLVLPELASGPGLLISTSVFVGAFLINLLSGLIIAEVAIEQHESSGNEVPSSFKEFAEVNLNQNSGSIVSGISLFVNSLVLAFNTVKAGYVGSAIVEGVSSDLMSILWALACIALVGTQNNANLSNITSFLVTGLFLSFAGLLLPGLANMADPVSILMTPGSSVDISSSAAQLAPIVLMSLVYQNIVPTVTKILGYDRAKTVASIVLGSFVPLCMYVAWTFAVVGGGVDTSVGFCGPLMALFSVFTIAGSSIGCGMSLAEEFDNFFKPANLREGDFSMPAVIASVGLSWVAAQVFAGDLTSALKVAGSFGSPLLYGALPVTMVYLQRQKKSSISPDLVPGGVASLGILGLASTGFVGNELLQTLGNMLSVQPV